ncbi:hypothetical protein FRB94_004770 [Tulasnella sp. JGI-2019a]|nr:hypothetical protein FRB94_004770 [Tulasnella sp. JGI-2019a]
MSCSSTASDWDGSDRISEEPHLIGLSYRTLHRRHVADSTQHLDCSSPISHLPDELLLDIFILALAASSHKGYIRDIVSLQLASKRWSRIVLGTPSLWGRISSSNSNRERSVAVLRSKESPLWVDYNDNDFDNDEDRSRFINYAIRNAYRWQLVKFVAARANTLALLRDFAPLSVPLLEELTIWRPGADGGPSEGESIDIFGGTAGRLRHVSLIYFPILWSSQIFSRLETLKINGTAASLSGIFANDITDALRRCPNLRTLEVGYSRGRWANVSDVKPLEVEIVHLPFLTSFTLAIGNAPALSWIIATIRIPACTQLCLMCNDPTRNIFSHHLIAILSSAIRSLVKIELRLSASSLVLSGWSNLAERVIDITLNHMSPCEDLASLIAHTTGSVQWPPTDAYISCEDSLPFNQVAGILRNVSSITELALIGNSDQYIILLSHPTHNDGIYEWVLPNLEKLALLHCPQNSLQILTDLSRKRRGGTEMDRGDGAQLGLRKKLETIDVRMRDIWGRAQIGPFFTALRELKGDTWDGHRFSRSL